jgi:signal transduction histidine kinase/CheY-like chemotaxis protein
VTQDRSLDPATLKAILHDGPDLAWIAEPGGRLLFLSREGRRLLGISPDASLSPLTLAQIHPQWVQADGSLQLPGVGQGTDRWQGDTTLQLPDGSELPIRQTLLIHRSSSGQVELFSSLGQDRSPCVRAQRSLQERVKELTTLLAVNRELNQTHLRLEERMHGLAQMLPEGFRYPSVTEVRITGEEGQWATDGFRETPWMLASPIRARGELMGEVTVALTEDPLRELGENGPFLPEERQLMDQVAQSVGEAIERETWHWESFRAQRMETVGRLASGAAHDFNNLLSVIQGHAELAQGALPSSSPIAQDLSQILKATRQGTSLTGQLLSFSRTQPLEEEEVLVPEILAGVEPMVRSLAPERIDVAVEVEEEARIQVDVGKLDQALLNLVINAIDAIQGSGSITLRGGVQELTPEEVRRIPWHVEPGLYAELVVEDDGAGIPPELESRIFEPFFTTKAEGEGTGLGLSMVYGFVKQSRGHIFIESELDQGTTVHLLLPLALEGQDRKDVPAGDSDEGGEPKKASAQAVPAKTLLIAEDDPLVRRALRRLLEHDGHKVLEAPDGEAAFTEVKRRPHSFDLVIADLVMPRMGGVELMRALRTANPETKVVLMSGYHSERELAGRTVRGATAFLRKPFSQEEVRELINRILA